MKKVFESVSSNPLFQGIALTDFETMLGCLSARSAKYKKGGIILLSGDAVHFVGLILSGSVKIINEDTDGRITILAELAASEVFGEAFACAGVSQSPVTIEASSDSEILFIDYKRIVTACSSACPFHTKLIENMLQLIAKKNLALSRKIDILSKRTTREKLWCFFDEQRGGDKRFTISFNREEMAHYLCVDRSAMSNELSRMRGEGLIAYNKSTFEILKRPAGR